MAGRVVLQLSVRLSLWSGHRLHFWEGLTIHGHRAPLHYRPKEHARRYVYYWNWLQLFQAGYTGLHWFHWGEERRERRERGLKSVSLNSRMHQTAWQASRPSPSVSTSSSRDGGPTLTTEPTYMCPHVQVFEPSALCAQHKGAHFCGKGERVTPHYTLAGQTPPPTPSLLLLLPLILQWAMSTRLYDRRSSTATVVFIFF
jgi:hypothetical protein